MEMVTRFDSPLFQCPCPSLSMGLSRSSPLVEDLTSKNGNDSVQDPTRAPRVRLPWVTKVKPPSVGPPGPSLISLVESHLPSSTLGSY